MNNIHVRDTYEEAVHLRKGSSDNTFSNSQISHTGQRTPGIGEGLYIGSGAAKWVNKKPDRCDRNKVINNRFGPLITAEHIDAKEGTYGGLIEGNYFDGTGMSGQHYADCWVNLKGTNYVVKNNSGSKSFKHGFKVCFFF
jgi:hypothetical protein